MKCTILKKTKKHDFLLKNTTFINNFNYYYALLVFILNLQKKDFYFFTKKFTKKIA